MCAYSIRLLWLAQIKYEYELRGIAVSHKSIHRVWRFVSIDITDWYVWVWLYREWNKEKQGVGYRRWTARRAVSVKILSTVENMFNVAYPHQIEVMELEGYCWPTCSKQPRLVACRIGVVNKLHRRRRRRRRTVLLTTRSTCRGEIFEVWSLGRSSRGKYPNFWR